jgi:hypothetical protein
MSLRVANENPSDLEKWSQTLVGDLEAKGENFAMLETNHAERKKLLAEEQRKVSDCEVRVKDGGLLVES